MKEHELVESFQHIIHQKYAPAVVIIDEQFHVKYITSSAKQYIDTSEGFTKTYSLLNVAPEAVVAVVRAAITEIKKGQKRSVYPILPITYNNEAKILSITVELFEAEEDRTLFYAVIFEENHNIGKSTKDIAKRINLALHNQLADTEENLRKTIGKLKNINQNLLASNEKLQGANKKYISVNEELQAINFEYQETINELSISNKDVDNLLQSTDIGTVFLDDKLHIRKFTNPIKKLINIDDIDLKRPLKNFTHNLKNINIYTEAKAVLDNNQLIEKEVVSEEDVHYLMRAMSYDVDEGNRKGIVLSFINIQQLKDTEKALAESKLLYRSVFDHANDGIVLVNENEKKVSNVNQRQLDMLGYSREEYLKTTFSDIFSEIQSNGKKIATKLKHYSNVEGVKSTGVVEWTLKRKDKTFIEAEISTVNMPAPYEGYTLNIIRNITRRKQAQAEILRSRKRFETVFDNSSLGISIATSEFNIIQVNKTFARMMGYTPKQLSQMSFSDITHHEDRKLNKQYLDELMSGRRKVISFEKRYVKKNGTVFWARLWVSILNDGSGEDFFLANMRDITKEKQGVEAIRDSELRYRSLFEKNIDAVLIYELKNNKIRSANKSACKLFECSKKYLLEHTPMDFFPEFQENGEPTMQFFFKKMQLLCEKGEARYFIQLKTKKGKSLEAEVTVFRLYDSPDSEIVVQFKNITAQKVAEKSLQASEQRFRNLFENSAIGIGIFDVEKMIVVDCNQQFAQLHGFTIEEFKKTKSQDVTANVQADSRDAMSHLQEQIEAVQKNGSYTVNNWLCRRKDGTTFHTEVTLNILDEATPNIIFVYMRDITEKYAAQEAIKEREECFRSLFEHSADAVSIVDTRTLALVDCNKRVTEMYGLPKNELIGKSSMKFTTEVQVDGRPTSVHVQKHMETIKERGYCFVENWMSKRPDGSVFYSEVSLSSFPPPNDFLIIVQVRDVTEKHQAQQKIQEQKKYLDTIINLIPNVLFARDVEGRYVIANQSVANAYGQPLEEIIGKKYTELNHKTVDGKAHKGDEQVIKTGEPFYTQEMVELADGQQHTIQIFKIPIKSADGEVIQVLSLAYDITDLINTQQELQRINTILANADDAVIMAKAANGEVMYLNDSGFKKLGVSKDEDLSKYNIADFHSPEEAERILNLVIPHIAKFDTWNGEVRLKNMITGEELITSFTIIGHFADDGELEYTSVIARDINEQKKRDNALSAITYNIAQAYHGELFETIVKSIADSFGLTGCMVCKAPNENGYKEIVAMYTEGKFQQGQLPVDNTPCAKVYTEGIQVYKKDVQKLFPDLNKDFDPPIESYIGIPIYDSTNTLVAHIAVFDRKPLKKTDFIQTSLQIYASRIGAELERTEREKALQEQKDYLRTIIDFNPNLIFAKNKNHEFILVNKALADTYGEIPENILGKTDADFNLSLEEVNFYIEKDREVMETKKTVHVPLETITKVNGEVRSLQTTKVPILDKEGNVTQIIGIATDITELKRVEENLRKSQVRFKAVFENSYSIIAVVDAAGNLIEQNKPLRENGSTIDMVGQPIWKSEWFDHDKKVAAQVEKDFKNVAKGNHIINQCTYMKTAEMMGYMSYSGKPVYLEEGGELLFILAEARDITALMLAQKELSVKVDELNIKNEELKKYIDSNMQLENFAYITSHDLREPLRTISGFASLLERKYADKLDNTANEYLYYILDSTKSMNALIEDLLIFSQVHTGEHKVEKLDLNALLQQIMRSLKLSIEETNAKIKLKNIPKTINGNQTKMKQLFQNLISNAIKFRKPDTAPQITISAKPKGNFWEFTIQDNGIGINEEYFDKIFMIFKRLHTKNEYEGTGIGLSLCKKIVEQHGGKIHLESTLGEGTRFNFTIEK